MTGMGTGAEHATGRRSLAGIAGAIRRAASPIEEFLASKDPVWVWDAERGRIAWANAAGAAFWGEPDFESLRGRTFDTGAPGVARMEALARNRSSRSQWVEFLRLPPGESGKERLCCLQRLQLAGGERGVIVRALDEAVARNERNQANGENSKAVKPCRRPPGFPNNAATPLWAMADALGGYVLLDRQGVIVFASKTARRLLGRESGDLVGQPFVALFAGSQARIGRLTTPAPTGAASRPKRFDAPLLRADGGVIPCRTLLAPVPGGEGVCAALCDLTLTKALQRSLDASGKKAVIKSNDPAP
jgi:PAS domain S-box-containing protein